MTDRAKVREALVQVMERAIIRSASSALVVVDLCKVFGVDFLSPDCEHQLADALLAASTPPSAVASDAARRLPMTDAEREARDNLLNTLRSYARMEYGPDGVHPKTDRDLADSDASNRADVDAYRAAILASVREAVEGVEKCGETFFDEDLVTRHDLLAALDRLEADHGN